MTTGYAGADGREQPCRGRTTGTEPRSRSFVSGPASGEGGSVTAAVVLLAVLPPRVVGRRALDRSGEGGRPDLPAVGEVEEEPVGAVRRHVDGEANLRPCGSAAVTPLLRGMHVQVGEVVRSDGDEVPVGAEVRVEVGHRRATPFDAEGQLRLPLGSELTGEGDVVAVDVGRGRRFREVPRLVLAGGG